MKYNCTVRLSEVSHMSYLAIEIEKLAQSNGT